MLTPKPLNYETITLLKMLNAMDNGEVFSIGFRTCNLKKITGGEFIHFDNCVKHNHQTKAERMAARPQGEAYVVRKNPKHYENSTRNIKRTDTGELVKVHIRLIRIFNGKTVL